MSPLRLLIKSVLDLLGLLEPTRRAQRWLVEQRFQHYYSHRDFYEVRIHGRKITYSTKDEYSGRWFFPRYDSKIHEPGATQLLARICRDAVDTIDIGANLGWFTCIAASISSGTIHAFELDEDNLRRLNANVALNELENVKVRHVAVDNFEGNVSYQKDAGSAGVEYSVARENCDRKLQARAPATTLDRYVLQHCQSVDLLKIDVEGGEQRVLEGGRRTIREHRPHILLEVHPTLLKSLGTSVQAMLGELPDTYRIYHVRNFRRVNREVDRRFVDPSVFDPNHVSMLHAEPSDRPLSDLPVLSGPLYGFT